ncbi:MAG: hypothetical protein HPY66_2935 [Firmicutes bacterium]|nr:hypothetical protein [Bacillota bacterium]
MSAGGGIQAQAIAARTGQSEIGLPEHTAGAVYVHYITGPGQLKGGPL